jgi:hypothetical protein
MLYHCCLLLIFTGIVIGPALNLQYNTAANASYDRQVGTSESDDSRFLEYRGHGIRFEYPDSWIDGYQSKFGNRPNVPTILPYEIFHIYLPSSSTLRTLRSQPAAEFSAFAIPAENMTLKNTLENYTKMLGANPKIFKQIRLDNVSFGDLDGYGAIVKERTISDHIRNVAEIWTIKNDKQFLFVFSGDNRYENHIPVFRHIFESVEFNP